MKIFFVSATCRCGSAASQAAKPDCRRCQTADCVALWVKEQSGPRGLSGQSGRSGQSRRSGESDQHPDAKEKSNQSISSTKSTPSTYPELSANAALVLNAVVSSLLDRQLASLAAAFEREGGFTERLYRVRKAAR